MPEASDTLVDRLLRRLKNNPLIALLIVLGITVSATGAAWNNLPRSWRDWIGDHSATRQPVAAPLYPENGWVFAGYVDASDQFRWSSEQRIKIMRPSNGGERPHIIRVGDVVQPLRPIPQVIVDFHTHGTQNQLTPPWQITEIIRKSEDFTGRTYAPDEQLEVMDVSVSQLPGQDYAVWLRVNPVASTLAQ